MELSVAKSLLEKGVPQRVEPQVWADLGAGEGLFTRALCGLTSAGTRVYAIDREVKLVPAEASGCHVTVMQQDFETDTLRVPPLDGLVMANSLHFVADQPRLLRRLRHYLAPAGRVIIVEYDLLLANTWVPFPVSFQGLQDLAMGAGFGRVERMHEVPSSFRRANIYSALLKRE